MLATLGTQIKMFQVANIIFVATILVSSSNIIKQSQQAINNSTNNQISIRMPDIRPDHAEQYLCIAHRLPVSASGQFIVGFDPKSDASRVHHMLMYGCQLPGLFQRDSPNFVWDCSEMDSNAPSEAADDNGSSFSSFERAPVCDQNFAHKLMYGWAMDAPALKLPPSVGFKVGGQDSNINFLVLQVHYGHYQAFQQLPDLTDNSGLMLDMKPADPESGITRQAGVLVLISLGQVATGVSRHEIWCEIDEDIEMHPFRYRVHTHKLGTKVMGAKIDRSNQALGEDSLFQNNELFDRANANHHQLIGQGDPQKAQMFYPVKEKDLKLQRGDLIYAKCEFNNTKTHDVDIGQTGDDEMCNFYVMYWTDSPSLLSKDTCMSYNLRNTFNSLTGSWR